MNIGSLTNWVRQKKTNNELVILLKNKQTAVKTKSLRGRRT